MEKTLRSGVSSIAEDTVKAETEKYDNLPDLLDVQSALEPLLKGLNSVRDNAETSDASETTLNQQQLLEGFNLESLFDFSSAAPCIIRSADTDLKLEGHRYGALLTKPLTDIKSIQRRQVLILGFMHNEYLNQIVDFYQRSRGIDRGFGLLFTPVEVGRGEIKQKMSALTAFHLYPDNSEAQDLVEKGIEMISSGLVAFNGLVEILITSKNPFLTKVGREMQEIYTEMQHLNRNYILDPENNNEFFIGEPIVIFVDKAHKMALFLDFALLAKQDGYVPASYNITQPAEYKKGWNFLRPLHDHDGKKQVVNDSPRHNATTIFAGSNMSGKSFGLKKEFSMQLLAQTFGLVPCEEGNFHLYDSFAFLDRSASDHSNDLSALGTEIVQNWNSTITRLGKKPFLCCDEGFSTTDASGQRRMLRSIDLFIRNRRGRSLYATHNETFIEDLANDPNVNIYHFRTESDANGEIQYFHVLQPGSVDSMSLFVARKLGLQPYIVDGAAAYLRGEKIALQGAPQKSLSNVIRYTNTEREALKSGTQQFDAMFAEKPQGTPYLHNYSEDEDMKGFLSGIQDLFGRFYGVDEQSRLRDRRQRAITSNVERFVFNNAVKDPREVLERQKTFEILADNDRYSQIFDLHVRVLQLLYYFQFLSRNAGDLLKFNVVLHPYKTESRAENHEIMVHFLEMNRILLGDAFPYNEQFEKMKKLRKLLAVIEDIQAHQDIEEVTRLNEVESNKVITHPKALAAFEDLKAKFGVPEDFGYTTATLTRAAAHLYGVWLDREKRVGWKFTDGDFEDGKKLSTFLHYSECRLYYTDHELMVRRKSILRDFGKIAKDVKEDNPLQRHNKFSLARVRALKVKVEKLAQNAPTEKEMLKFNGYSDQLASMEDRFKSAQSDLPFVVDGEMVSHSIVTKALQKTIQKLADLSQHLPTRSIFDVSIETVRPHLEALLAYHVAHPDSDRMGEKPGPKGSLAGILTLLLEQRDTIAAFVAEGRAVDSVYVQQGMNIFEAAVANCFMTRHEYGEFRNDPDLQHLAEKRRLMSGPPLFEAIKDLYGLKIASISAEFEQLENEKAELVAQYPDVFLENYLASNLFIVYEFILKCIGGNRCTEQEAHSFFVNYKGRFTGKSEQSFSRYASFHEYMGAKDEEDYFKVFRDFLIKHVYSSELMRQMHEVIPKLKQLGKKVQAFIAKYESVPYVKKALQKKKYANLNSKIAEGELGQIREIINSRFSDMVSRIYGLPYDDPYSPYNPRVKIVKSSEQIASLFAIGHVISEQQQVRVEFHKKTDIEMRGSWSLFKDKHAQVPSDIVFAEGERLKMINGANMSGKTFWLKKFAVGVLWSLATGHAPATLARMPLLDSVIYFDRVRTISDQNLSALGNEVKFWRQVNEVLDQAESTLLIGGFDEIYSTTSPRYAEAMGVAQSVRFVQGGHLAAIAHHNHEMIDYMTTIYPGVVRPYYFATKMQKTIDGKPDFHRTFTMHTGHMPSQAVDVAEWLGLHPEIIKIARMLP